MEERETACSHVNFNFHCMCFLKNKEIEDVKIHVNTLFEAHSTANSSANSLTKPRMLHTYTRLTVLLVSGMNKGMIAFTLINTVNCSCQ